MISPPFCPTFIAKTVTSIEKLICTNVDYLYRIQGFVMEMFCRTVSDLTLPHNPSSFHFFNIFAIKPSVGYSINVRAYNLG